MSKTTYMKCFNPKCQKTNIFNTKFLEGLNCAYCGDSRLEEMKVDNTRIQDFKQLIFIDKDLNTEVAKFTGKSFEVMTSDKEYYVTFENRVCAIFDMNIVKLKERNAFE